MKAILLAGGNGTRFAPVTKAISKHTIPIYNKPLIYYSLSVIMLAGIREVCIVTSPDHNEQIYRLFEDGNDLGLKITYKIQEEAKGIAQALSLASEFVGSDDVMLMLGDNIIYGQGLSNILAEAKKSLRGASIFTYSVKNPEDFGVLEIDDLGKPTMLKEKPSRTHSNLAVVGMYLFKNDVLSLVNELTPSARGEFEITDVNKGYLQQNRLDYFHMGRGYTWLDAGTPDAALQASQYIAMLEERQGLMVACLEEIALQKKWITTDKLKDVLRKYNKTEYGKYLTTLL